MLIGGGLVGGGVLVDVDATGVINVLEAIQMRGQTVDLLDTGSVVVSAMEAKIDAEGQVGPYPRWQELSEDTKRRRSGARMLRGPTGLLGQFQVEAENSRSVLVSSPAPYAIYHVQGHLIPRRDFTEIDEEAMLEEAGLLVVSHVVEG